MRSLSSTGVDPSGSGPGDRRPGGRRRPGHPAARAQPTGLVRIPYIRGSWLLENGVMDLVISLDGKSGTTVVVYRALREAIVDGRLPVGQRLPPTRALADDLRVSRGSVTTAYERLAAEGYLTA